MKHIRALVLIGALLAAMSAYPAIAEESSALYAGFFDNYYHMAERCALAGTVSEIGLREAKAQGKYPCPVCVDDDIRYKGVRSVVRGGTLVIRVPDDWMRKQRVDAKGTLSIETLWLGDYSGRDADLALSELLHGADYRAFLDALATRGSASTGDEEGLEHARVPDIALADGALTMNRRHIGAAWYLVIRPGEADRASLADHGRVSAVLGFAIEQLRMQSGALTVNQLQRWQDPDFAIKPKKSKNKTRFMIEQGDLALAVYGDMQSNICVIRQGNVAGVSLADAALTIDGVAIETRMNGYFDGTCAIFCCMLTDAEADALEGGAQAAVALQAAAPSQSSDALAEAFRDALADPEGEADASEDSAESSVASQTEAPTQSGEAFADPEGEEPMPED